MHAAEQSDVCHVDYPQRWDNPRRVRSAVAADAFALRNPAPLFSPFADFT